MLTTQRKSNRVGETIINSYGSLVTIVEYNNAKDIVVEFENGYKVHTCYSNFQKKNVKSPYDKTVVGVGYVAEGYYNPKTHKFIYIHWKSMLSRCYDDKRLKLCPTYEDKCVCEEWHSFQNFAKWFDENYYSVGNEKMCLDKDIIKKGNKVYNEDNCIFVPERINQLFLKRQNDRGRYPIGVTKTESNNFMARCNTFNNNKITRIALGRFNTPEEAFYKYKEFKEKYIKQVADEYKDKIPKKLYDAMYRYVVDIND